MADGISGTCAFDARQAISRSPRYGPLAEMSPCCCGSRAGPAGPRRRGAGSSPPRSAPGNPRAGKAQPAPHLAAIEGLAERPAGIDAAHGAQAGLGLGGVLLPSQAGIGLRCRAHAFEEDEIQWRRPGRPAIDHDAFDSIAEQGCPVVGLLGAHRPAIDQFDAVDAEQLSHHAALLHDVVVGRDRGKSGVFDGDDDRPLVNMFGMTMK